MSELIAGSVLGQINNNGLAQAIQDLNALVRRQIELVQKPFVFLKSNNNILSSNVADAAIILPGPNIPAGHKGVVEDFNVNFTTAVGTVRLVILNTQNGIVIDILRDITSSTNGTGKTVLEENQRLGIVGQSAGAGTFSVYCSGYMQKVN